MLKKLAKTKGGIFMDEDKQCEVCGIAIYEAEGDDIENGVCLGCGIESY